MNPESKLLHDEMNRLFSEQKTQIDKDIAAYDDVIREKYLKSPIQSGFCIRPSATFGSIVSSSCPILKAGWYWGFRYSEDFKFIVPFIVQFGLYISPVGFTSEVVPEQWRLLYSLNPMVGVIDGFRWAVLGGESRIYMPGFLVSCSVIAFFLWLGIRKFRSMEKSFADLV